MQLLRKNSPKKAYTQHKSNGNVREFGRVCACGFILIRSPKGQESALLACPKADGFIRPALTGKTLAQPHAVVNAVVGCQLMRHTNVQVEDGILYLP